MDYRVAFDVSQAGFQWWIPFLTAVVSALVIVVGWALKNSGEMSSIAFRLLVTAGLLLTPIVFACMYAEYQSSIKGLSTRDYTTVEGVVTDFVHVHHGKSTTESFRVNGILFRYGNSLDSAAFSSDWNRGFIHNGVEARITYRGSDILRVEVR